MPFDESDPRARLSASSGPTTASHFGAISYAKFYETDPQLRERGGATWIARGQHFVLAYSELEPGATLERIAQEDEHFMLLPDPASAKLSVNGVASTLDGRQVVIIPPGDSHVTMPAGGRVVRLFTSAAADLAALSSNSATYESPAPNLAPLAPWPEPVGGYKLRTYDLDVEGGGSRFGRIWRSRSLMVNYSYPRPGPRDVTKMSPHSHADFEQGSLVVDGSFVHHTRWPWTTNMHAWRADEHEICAGPSFTVIPAHAIHTSHCVGREVNQLVDVFAPPRTDFSEMSGWVLNADEYPMPS